MYYPLLFTPLYKNYIWGGRKLASLGKMLPEGNVAESWEIACHSDGTSIVSNGLFSGIDLNTLLQTHGMNILGSALYIEDNIKFPILIKLIDASRDLSVQVHPDDKYAFINENGELGKSEMWYIIDALPGSKLVSGIKKGITKKLFIKAIADGNIGGCLNYVDVFPGDCFNIPAGLVHAIGQGIVLCEIQQNSNTTYRVYDYNRIDNKGNKRPLHIEKALDVIDFNSSTEPKCKGLFIEKPEYRKTFLVTNKYFAVELFNINGTFNENTHGERFYCYTVLKGELVIENVIIKAGHSCLIPAAIGSYSLSGNCNVIKSYVPD